MKNLFFFLQFLLLCLAAIAIGCSLSFGDEGKREPNQPTYYFSPAPKSLDRYDLTRTDRFDVFIYGRSLTDTRIFEEPYATSGYLCWMEAKDRKSKQTSLVWQRSVRGPADFAIAPRQIIVHARDEKHVGVVTNGLALGLEFREIDLTVPTRTYDDPSRREEHVRMTPSKSFGIPLKLLLSKSELPGEVNTGLSTGKIRVDSLDWKNSQWEIHFLVYDRPFKIRWDAENRQWLTDGDLPKN